MTLPVDVMQYCVNHWITPLRILNFVSQSIHTTMYTFVTTGYVYTDFYTYALISGWVFD